MKVGVFLIDILPSAGGSFSLVDKLVKGIDAYQFEAPVDVCFVGRIPAMGSGLTKPYVKICAPWIQRIFLLLRKFGVLKAIRFIFAVDADLCNRWDIETLRANKIDLLLFPKQLSIDVPRFPFMSMSWDSAHKSTYLFPEFIDSYDVREQWYRVEIQKALAIIVESKASVNEFSQYFGINKSKLEVVPLFPGDVVSAQVSEADQADILKKMNLTASKYYIYPAQFWASKNHYNLVLAFKKLLGRTGRNDLKLVMPGSDKGNKGYIETVVKQLGLADSIIMPGFVSNDELYTLYKRSIALVMPTFLGPTNMPPLEAQLLQVPVICSDFEGHRDMCGAGALYADPSNADQWADSMESLLDESRRKQLVQLGNEALSKSEFNMQNAIKKLEAVFIKYIPIRKTFY